MVALSSFGITSMIERFGYGNNITSALEDGILFLPEEDVIMVMVPFNIVTYCDMMWISEDYPTRSSVFTQWTNLMVERFPKVEREKVGEYKKFAIMVMSFVFEPGGTFKIKWDDFVVNGQTPIKVVKENYLRTTGPQIVNSPTSTIVEANMGTDIIYILYYDFFATGQTEHPKVTFYNTYGSKGKIVWEANAFEKSTLMIQIYANVLEIMDYVK
jgi:hypothetical protein